MNSAKLLALLVCLAALMAALVLAPVTNVHSAEPSAALATSESFAGIDDTAARSAARSDSLAISLSMVS